MGVFDFLKKKEGIVLGAPVGGKAVDITKVPDPTFSDGLMGKGVAIEPSEGVLRAPIDAKIDLMFDTGHAVNLITDSGLEILIHVGLETISLKGEGFTVLKQTGDSVKKGDELIKFDLDFLKSKGFETITPMVICNSDDFKDVKVFTSESVKAGDKVLEVIK
ncbi:MAG TPA: PTS glucose transporter subunit IIA [Candidatus Ornithospirochaeta avicola]|uniref:PTS system glucose-specific EIIA component n=1 Tax=Candidatus Ornithospirochaeta avicola TaxID=2840896 RepID=A0A9D1PV65_9SPIO|nr:PTS glucose transporter subunit IIA [Candidatus Ornithospirochaeta avicola]